MAETAAPAMFAGTTTTNYQLAVVGHVGMPNPAITVGVWPAGTVMSGNVRGDSLFTVTVAINPADTNAVILANVHTAVDTVLTAQDTENQLLTRLAPFLGTVVPHTHTS